MSDKGHSRRKFLKYAGVGVVAAAAGIGYLTRGYWSPSVPNPTTQSPTFLPTETPTVKPLKAAFDYSPKYRYILQNPSQTIEFKNLTQYSGDVKPACEWSTDDVTSQNWDYSIKLPPGKHTVTLTARDGKTSDWTGEEIEVDEYGPDYPQNELKVKFKGIVYWVGETPFGFPTPSEARMKEDLEIIRNDEYGLGCNAIRLSGNNDDALLRCAEIAIENSFDLIKLNPRYIDATETQTIKLSEGFAKKAENLRATSNKSARIQYQIGQELSIDCSTILGTAGENYVDRSSSVGQRLGTYSTWKEKLNNLLNELAKVARRDFQGEITYAQGPWESIDWSKLDVDVRDSNEYTYEGMTFREYASRLRMLTAGGKPLHVTEFGSVTFTGAGKYGGSGWLHDGMYDEDDQANSIKGYLEVFNQVRPEAVFLFCWFEPTSYGKKMTQTFNVVREETEQQTWTPSMELPLHRKKSFYMYKSYRRVGS